MGNYKITLSAIIVILVLLAILAGCTRRENPTLPTAAPEGMVFDLVHEYNGLTDSQWSEFPGRHISVYTPPGYGTGTTGKRFPTLYMLPGYDGEPSFFWQRGNENYYLVSAVARIADELIASGDIKPMLIVMPDASFFYGGSFYADNELSGNWEDMMANELLDWIDGKSTPNGQTVFRTLDDPESRAISGHSSGGYGAMRLAMKYPEKFNSVSAIDAPLAFAGGDDAEFDGIKSLFDDYLTESGISTLQDFLFTDTTGFRKQPIKMLLYSMAATFSPVEDFNTVPTAPFEELRIDLPFDYLGVINQPVWDKWLANDLYSWLDDSGYQRALDSLKIYLEYSDHDAKLFNRQTELFAGKLKDLGIKYKSATFSGYDGSNPQARTFLHDRLYEILKFHNRYLKDRDGKY